VKEKMIDPLPRKNGKGEVPRGAYCTHRKMQYARCSYCPHNCRVECPECGFTWMFNEGIHG